MFGTSTFGRAVMRSIRQVAVVILAGAAGAAILSTVQVSHRAELPQAAAVPATDADLQRTAEAGSSVVTLDRNGQEKGGIETATPRAVTYQDQIRAYGTVLPLDRLTLLYNQAITADAQLQAAKVKQAASKIANDRAQNLLKVFTTAKAQAEAAEAALNLDSASVVTAQAQLDVLRNTAIQDWGPRLGDAIIGRRPLVEDLVLRKSVLIQLSVQPGVFASPPAHITLSFGETPRVSADLVSESTHVDPRIQNLGFWYVAPASSGLVAGTNILALLPRGETKPGSGIPPSAVVWQAGKPWMFVRAGTERFERRVIDGEAAPTPDGGYVVPATSLPADERIVVVGAQTLLSEETRAQMPAQEDDN